MHIAPVILAGGIGERFWPLSRTTRPKQLLPLISRKTMIEETLLRCAKLGPKETRPLIVTAKAQAPRIRKALGAKHRCDYIAEPVGKNTAPAVALAAAWLENKYGPVVMLVLSADHQITPVEEFAAAVRHATERAQHERKLVVFGIQPSRPDTGYGYIEINPHQAASDQVSSHIVKRFVEKPDWDRAVAFSQSGHHFWNSGMFVWRSDDILAQFRLHSPEMYKLVNKVSKERFSQEAITAFYAEVPRESVDYAIMEKAENVVMVAGRFLWDDVGSWESVARIHPGNALHTTISGKRIYESGCRQTIIVNDSPYTVAAIGLENLVVVTTADAVLVMPRTELGSIKQHLAALKQRRDIPSSLF